ncbi:MULTISPECIES: hypothetical protein [Aphanothece]|uniref:hypothetical protein n=1 Tax=Aphanothece TaxID=1121 RepID=UPI0039856B27
MMTNPPTNQLSYLARKAICGALESGDYVKALESAQTVLRWQDCQSSPEFQAQVVAIIGFCGPLADKQRRERVRAEEQQRQEKEREAIRRAEARAKAELLKDQIIATFGPLAQKYGAQAEAVVEGSEPSYLVVILQELEETGNLTESHVNWLQDNNFYLVLANYYYSSYLKDGDAWNLAKSGRYFRQGECANAIVDHVSDDTISKIHDGRARSAVLTNRGGAKRDLSDLEGAKQDGLDAISASPQSFHPHNLLGAVYYQTGQPALGDQHFEKAVNLGASPRQQEFEIRSALKMSSPEARQAVVQHLLRKDPVKYAWVNQYQDIPQDSF